MLALTLLLGACEEEDNFKITSADPAFVINTPSINNILLNFALPDNPAFTISWIDEINSGATYTVEMSVEETFASPISLGSTSENTFTMTVAQFNAAFNNTSVKSYASTPVYMRLNTGSVNSNTITFLVSKYAENAPTITSPDNTFGIVLSNDTAADTALTVTWEDPEVDANSTVVTTYDVVMAEAGTSFASPISLGTSNSNSFEITHDDLNDIVISAGGQPDVAASFDVRIKAIASSASGDLIRTSEMITISLTAFKVPIPDNLFMVGGHNGWNNADPTQQFFNDGNGVFSKVQKFNANDEFKMLPNTGKWDGDYGEDPNNPGKILQDGEQNIKVTTAGTYIVFVDFNNLSFNLVSIDTLFMVGGHNGWNNADPTQEFYTSGNGVFTRIQTFAANDEFKLLPTSGSWDNDWGVNKTKPGTLELYTEDNIKVETAGTYMVTIDFNTLSFLLTEVPTDLHLVGTPNGWDNTSGPAFTKVSEGLFEITQTLTDSDEFKLLPFVGQWDNDWGESGDYPGMVVRENENNIKSPGAGTYKITVDYNKGTITFL